MRLAHSFEISVLLWLGVPGLDLREKNPGFVGIGGGRSFEEVEKFLDFDLLRSGFDFDLDKNLGVFGVYGGGVGTVILMLVLLVLVN